MANLTENDAIDRFKRGSEKFKVKWESISATKKRFIETKIKALYKDLSDVHKYGKVAKTIRHSYFTFFLVRHQSASLLKKNMPFSYSLVSFEKCEICTSF